MGDKVLTPEDAAKILKVHPNTIRKWLRNGTIKGSQFNGRLWRITESAINETLKEIKSDTNKVEV